MTVRKTTLILGGGIGGVVSASLLSSKLSREYRIRLIERNPMYLFTLSFLWLMTGLRSSEQISRPFSELGKKGVEII